MRSQLPYSIQKSHIEYQDSELDLEDLTNHDDDTLFHLTSLPALSVESDDSILQEFKFEMNRDLIVIEKHKYTVFDVLSDIGGIQAILMSSIQVILRIINYKNFEINLASRLYKVSLENSATALNSIQKSETIRPGKICGILDFCLNLIYEKLNCCRCCCKKSYRMLAI